MGDGDIEHESLEHLLLAGHLGEKIQVAHHLQTIGDLDHRHARIGGILDDQLFILLRLEAGVARGNGCDLVETVNNLEDRLVDIKVRE